MPPVGTHHGTGTHQTHHKQHVQEPPRPTCLNCHRDRLHVATQNCHKRNFLVITHTHVQVSKFVGDQGMVLVQTALATWFVERFFMKFF